ncbi:MAG: hypothetical protein AAB524_01570, partial [Patescibacteria group bacterium]
MRHWRANLVLFLLFGLGVIIVGRLVFLQIINQGFYKALAQGQQNVSTFTKGERGTLFVQDKNGNFFILASNQKVPFAFVSPAEVKNREETAFALAKILQLEPNVILSKLQNENSLFEVLKKRISEVQVQQIQEFALAGVYVGQE